jgi:nucleotide-binding universal stress UspA family protein
VPEVKFMPGPESILCPIDFSEFSIKAYDYAQSLARHYKAELVIQHVLYSYPAFYADDAYKETCRRVRADALRKLKEFVKRHTRVKIQPQCVVQEGNTTDLIISLSQKRSTDLIVMGTHGLRGVDHLMLGSVTERVLRKACCLVLVVRKPEHDFVSPGRKGDPINVRRIVLCMDFSDHAHRALKYAFGYAREYKAELTLLHVVEHFPKTGNLQLAMGKALKQLKESVPYRKPKAPGIKFLVRVGRAYQQIIEVALETKTDLAVMGVRGHVSLESEIFGSTIYRVIQLGPCPVLAVRI